ncbi:hypothetical protein WLV93_22510, partial [Bordetella bronchiseptica]
MSALFSALQIGALELPNRIVVSPMCQYSAREGQANEWHMQHLMQLALSGAGLVMVEATAVEPRGRISHGCLGLYSDATEAALARVLAAARAVAAPAGPSTCNNPPPPKPTPRPPGAAPREPVIKLR